MSDFCGVVSCVVILIAAFIGFYPLLKRRKQAGLWDEVPDDDTPRIVWNEDDGVMVKFGNTPNYSFYTEAAAKALKGVRDERK